MKNNFNKIIALHFHDEIVKDNSHRYKSWEHCYNAFAKPTNENFLSLQLAFYLASWGMYRGSSGLLQKDYIIHNRAVQILLKKEYKKLHCKSSKEVSRENIDLIIQLKDELKQYYEKIKYTKIKKYKSDLGTGTIIRSVKEENNISGTDTLISKIILGTLACVPAFDRYFNDGLKKENIAGSKFNKSSLNNLFDFIEDNNPEIINFQKAINTKEIHYPIMKIIDMYFWEIGFEEDLKKIKLFKSDITLDLHKKRRLT